MGREGLRRRYLRGDSFTTHGLLLGLGSASGSCWAELTTGGDLAWGDARWKLKDECWLDRLGSGLSNLNVSLRAVIRLCSLGPRSSFTWYFGNAFDSFHLRAASELG